MLAKIKFIFIFFYNSSMNGAQFLIPVVCYPMFKPYEIHDERARIELDHELYLQSPELRILSSISFFSKIFCLLNLELNDLLHKAAFKGGLSRALSISSDMMKRLSHKQVKTR